jgi:diguanylate cyclase (GGDEF)-like protein
VHADWCASLGGEEFAVVLAGTKIPDTHVCAERMPRVIENTPIDTPTASIRITVSIGISALGEMAARNAATVNSLLEQADIHLYASKASGRNRVTSSKSMYPRLAPRRLARPV